MMRISRWFLAAAAGVLLLAVPMSLSARDEGMWTFNNFPGTR